MEVEAKKTRVAKAIKRREKEEEWKKEAKIKK